MDKKNTHNTPKKEVKKTSVESPISKNHSHQQQKNSQFFKYPINRSPSDAPKSLPSCWQRGNEEEIEKKLEERQIDEAKQKTVPTPRLGGKGA